MNSGLTHSLYMYYIQSYNKVSKEKENVFQIIAISFKFSNIFIENNYRQASYSVGGPSFWVCLVFLMFRLKIIHFRQEGTSHFILSGTAQSFPLLKISPQRTEFSFCLSGSPLFSPPVVSCSDPLSSPHSAHTPTPHIQLTPCECPPHSPGFWVLTLHYAMPLCECLYYTSQALAPQMEPLLCHLPFYPILDHCLDPKVTCFPHGLRYAAVVSFRTVNGL